MMSVNCEAQGRLTHFDIWLLMCVCAGGTKGPRDKVIYYAKNQNQSPKASQWNFSNQIFTTLREFLEMHKKYMFKA